MKHVRPNVSQFAAQWTQAQPITEPEKPKLKPRPRRRNRIPILETPDLPHEEREADENAAVEAVNDGKRAAENVACFVNDAGYRRNVRAYRKEIREIRPDNGRVKPPGQAAAAFDSEIAALMPEMQKRKDASAGSTDWPWILICIDDLKRCIDSINDQTLRRLASILVLGKGLRVAVIVSGNAADITKLSASGERFTMEMTGKTTLLLGGSAQAHMFARTDLAYSAASQDAGAGMGYLVQDGHAVKLKAVQK